MKPANFYGYDEWTILFLLSRGVIDIPYANRPLELLWALPVPWIAPHTFLPFSILHWLYLWLTALLVLWIALRLAPGRSLLAFLAGVFVLVWAPNDHARLSTVERTLYGGITFGMTLTMAVYVESWVRRSVPLLAASLLLCVVSGRCYEATLSVLLVTPVLLLGIKGGSPRELRQWILVFQSFVLFSLLLALQPMLFPTGDPSYQASYGLDTRPEALLTRLALQCRLHFGPLVSPGWMELLAPGVAVAAAVFLGSCLWWMRSDAGQGDKGDLRVAVGVGLLLTGAGYGALLLTGRQPGAWRMQFLSSPGAALLLSGAAIAIGERFRRRGALVAVALAGWVVTVGTARTLAMQRQWDGFGFYQRQMRLLSSLVGAVPDVQPRSLIVLLDDGKAWRADFGFHHAVEYLYRGHAIGVVWGASSPIFPAFFARAGVVSEPMPAVRTAWGARPSLYRYDALIVVRHTTSGAAVVLDEWPLELPPLPPAALYRPRARIRPPGEPIPQRRALWSLEPGDSRPHEPGVPGPQP